MLGATGNSLRGAPLALIREALRSVINETQAQTDMSTSTSINLPFVMDLGNPNSGQSTQARLDYLLISFFFEIVFRTNNLLFGCQSI